MSDEEFSKLLNGPLHHPMMMFQVARLIHALHHVMLATGQAGEQALREYCAKRQEADERQTAEEA